MAARLPPPPNEPPRRNAGEAARGAVRACARDRLRSLGLGLVLTLGLAGCDLLGIEPASATAARKEAEGKAVGGACRHAGRAIEDCYTLNKKADKAAVFAGWREMNDYMRENKIENVAPQIPTQAAPPKPEAEDAADDHDAPADKPSKGDKADKAAPKKAAAKH